MMIFDEKSDFFRENRQFLPLIKYYANRIKSDTAEVDLWGFLWLLQAKKQPPNDRYIAVCLRNEYIRLSKNCTNFTPIFTPIKEKNIDYDIILDLEKSLRKLTKKERSAVLLQVVFGYTSREVGEMLGISSQAVNQCKNRGLTKLRKLVIL